MSDTLLGISYRVLLPRGCRVSVWKEAMKLPCASHSQGPAGSETNVTPHHMPKLQLVRGAHVASLFRRSRSCGNP